MVKGGVLIQNGTVTLGIHEYLRDEPVVLGLLDPPVDEEMKQDTSTALIEYVMSVFEVKSSHL